MCNESNYCIYLGICSIVVYVLIFEQAIVNKSQVTMKHNLHYCHCFLAMHSVIPTAMYLGLQGKKQKIFLPHLISLAIEYSYEYVVNPFLHHFFLLLLLCEKNNFQYHPIPQLSPMFLINFEVLSTTCYDQMVLPKRMMVEVT